jgi:hypothetical protein
MQRIMDNQRIMQSTPAIFSFKYWTTAVVITVGKVRAPSAGRRTAGAPNMYWPHIWWLIQAVKIGVDCKERYMYAALVIHCIDCSVANYVECCGIRVERICIILGEPEPQQDAAPASFLTYGVL